jgi:hypothetical protein
VKPVSAKELERRRKISEAKKGKKRPDVAERNRSEAMRTAPRVMSDEAKERMARGRTKHGHARRRPEGRGGTPTYYVWAAMIQRCTNPNNADWNHYGGRGIEVCSRWRDFRNFLADMGEQPDGLTLDRINGDDDYGPGNCRWATTSVQQRNTRRGQVTQATIDFIRANPDMTYRDLADATGISVSSVGRVRRGER